MNIPLTLKMRTGIQNKQSVAHSLIPKLRDWGVSMVTVHGRSKEQRYTKLADYHYLNQCAETVCGDIPVFGEFNKILFLLLSYITFYIARQR